MQPVEYTVQLLNQAIPWTNVHLLSVRSSDINLMAVSQ